MGSRFDWFADRVAEHGLLTLTAVRGPGVEDLLAELEAGEVDRGGCTLREARDAAPPAVRVGTTQGWVYAVESTTVRGADPALLERLTVEGGEAVVLCFTPATGSCLHARDGVYVTGFDAAVPEFRWGREPHALDTELTEVGLLSAGGPLEGDGPLGGGGPRPAAACAELVERRFGLTVPREALDGRLPCATLYD
ncbi:DUF6461 domain-containing protein [Geodermatophilus sp. SYSU D00708]